MRDGLVVAETGGLVEVGGGEGTQQLGEEELAAADDVGVLDACKGGESWVSRSVPNLDRPIDATYSTAFLA